MKHKQTYLSTRIHRPFWLVILLVMSAFSTALSQSNPSVTLSYGDPKGNPDDAFDGNVFQSGNQIGDAPVYATLSGGATSFQVVSPGESMTKTVNSTGYFFIRPTGSVVIDKTKILNFSGAVTGSVAITVKPLSITTISANVTTETDPGSELTVSYRTGAGTFPIDLALNKFKVQLLDASGNLVSDLLNSTDQYAGYEKQGVSRGGTRFIKATLPANVLSGTYRVRVITQGLTVNVTGSSSSPFTVRNTAPAIGTTGVGTGSFCAGTVVSFPFSTTGTFPQGNQFKVRLTNAFNTSTQDLAEASLSSPIRATLPSDLFSGTFFFQIVSIATGVVSAKTPINVTALPTITLSGNTSIVAGTPANVQVKFTGTPPWAFDYVDYRPGSAPNYKRSASFSSVSALIMPTLIFSSNYDKSFISNFRDSGCGISTLVSGSASVMVAPIQVTPGNLTSTYCPGSTISVPFTINSPLPTDAVLQVRLSDNTGNFQNGVIIGSGDRSPIAARLPQTLSSGTGYKLQFVVQKPAISGAVDYSEAITSGVSSLAINRPDAPKTTDVPFCSGTTLSPLTAIGSNLSWYLEGSSQPLPTAPTPPNDRSSRYYVSQTISGCESSQSVLNVTRKPTPPAPSTNNLSLCQGEQGQFTAPFAGALWYASATGGQGTPQPPGLNNQVTGEQTVYLTQTIDGCESPRTAVKATINAIPAAPVVQSPAPVCQYAIATFLSAAGQNLTWYDQSGKLTDAPTPETSASGVRSYSVSQKVSGCESSRASVEQLVRPAPALPMAGSARFCVGELPRSLTAVGTNLRWYSIPTGGTSSSGSPAFFTDTPNVFTFYVTQTDNTNCESLRLPVAVSVLAPPAPPTVNASQTVCQFAKANPLTATPSTGLVWQGTGIAGSTETAPTPSTAEPASYTYSVVQKAGSCVSTPATINFTVRKLPDAPTVVSPTAFCIGQTSTVLSATATGRLTWYQKADRSGSAQSQVIANTERSSVTTYYVTQTDNVGCESVNSLLEVRVATRATARLTGDGDIYPGDSTAIRIRLTGDGPWSFLDLKRNRVITTDSVYVVWVRPTTTTTYAITNLSSTCGTGDILNSYTLTVRVPLGTQAITEPILLNAYPNPTTGDVSIEWNSPARQAVRLQLLDAGGRVIQQLNRQATGSLQTEAFQLSHQPAGLYLLRLTTPTNGVVTQKILKQ